MAPRASCATKRHGVKALRPDSRSAPVEQFRVNHRIRIPRVRVIGSDGGQIGIVDTQEALKLARDEGLDLVEISPKAVPPVCKIMDYGRFKYEEKKKANEAKKKQVVVKVKEVKLRPKTEEHDYETKLRHVREFIEEGNKAKITIMFRGREITHRELGTAILDDVMTDTKDIAVVDQQVRLAADQVSHRRCAAFVRDVQQVQARHRVEQLARGQPAALAHQAALQEGDQDVAAAVAYLASDDAKFITGTELVVDGGLLAQ